MTIAIQHGGPRPQLEHFRWRAWCLPKPVYYCVCGKCRACRWWDDRAGTATRALRLPNG